ncbi:MAG: VCBS repeat-containing protein, partial [Gemmatimonadetes bacterium]|nr:VCBS repeat-containing protein [Gemmatimonadota bacterium]
MSGLRSRRSPVTALDPRVHLALAIFLLVAARPAAATFVDVTDLWGVASGDSMSYAAGFVDFDGDGDTDFYANNHWLGQDFYDNLGTPPMRVTSHYYPNIEPDRHDQLWADFNKDGTPDNYLIHGREQDNEFFWNRGGGILEDGAIAAGVDDTEGRGREITFLDVENDGDLDIFVANDYRNGFLRPSVLFVNNGDETFSRFPNTSSWCSARLHCASADFDQDGDPDLITTNPPYQAGEFWRNDGAIAFNLATDDVFPGIFEPFREANGLTWADYDNDG